MLSSFDAAAPGTLDLAIKKQNTADLLNRALVDVNSSPLGREIDDKRRRAMAAAIGAEDTK
jgi:hypothetical protein